MEQTKRISIVYNHPPPHPNIHLLKNGSSLNKNPAPELSKPDIDFEVLK
jgi:hypothetical protein